MEINVDALSRAASIYAVNDCEVETQLSRTVEKAICELKNRCMKAFVCAVNDVDHMSRKIGFRKECPEALVMLI